jgi:hypothetical protein
MRMDKGKITGITYLLWGHTTVLERHLVLFLDLLRIYKGLLKSFITSKKAAFIFLSMLLN